MGNKNMYYNVGNTLSRKKLFNFVLGPRGAGKTYGAKKQVIKNWLERGEQFVYLRRYDTEIPESQMRNFFDDIMQEFPDHEFKALRGLFRIDGEVVGWYFPLSKAQVLKSIPFPNVTLIIFDEFIINTGLVRYLPAEVTTFLECYSTISRDRDVPVLFLSNALSISNPYFLYFNISFESSQKSKIMGDISIEFVENKAFTTHMNETRFGKLIAGTAYGDYAVNNKFLLDTDTFIEKMSSPGHYAATIDMGTTKCGVYRDLLNGLTYISEKIDPECTNIVAMKVETHNTASILATRNNVLVQMIMEAFTAGALRFENQTVKNACYPVIRKLM